MRSYLLTWYGITDLRASLGLEASDGPVLGALSSGTYTHVLILAYTDPTKVGPEAARAQDLGSSKLATARDAGSRLGRSEQSEIVDAYANTPEGHELFAQWLLGEIRARKLGTAIRVVQKELESLSDARGTYEAAAEALDVVLSTEGEREVTLYLSPGTPVMAFTWAFVSLMNPELNLRVIASPDYRREPDEVRLPFELLVPSTRGRRSVVPGGRGELDVVFHLFGEQRLPSLLGILQFPAKRHVFVTSPKYPAGCMERFMPEGAVYSDLMVNPFDPMSANVKILRAIASLPSDARVGFNLTGGTKLMFAGAQAACRKVGGVPFYFETRDHTLVFLDDFATMDVRGVEDVERFIELGGFRVSRSGLWNDNPARERRRDLTAVLWNERKWVAKLYRDLSEVTQRGWAYREFQVRRGRVSASLDSHDCGRIRLGESEFKIDECADFASYLCGGWLEEYVYALLEPAFHAGSLRDLRIGLEVAWTPTEAERSQFAAQEFDVTFTDGTRLFIVECKAGRVINEDVYKLENSTRKYGGVHARGILASAFPPPRAPRRRLQSGSNLSWLAGRDVPTLAREISKIIR